MLGGPPRRHRIAVIRCGVSAEGERAAGDRRYSAIRSARHSPDLGRKFAQTFHRDNANLFFAVEH